MHTLYEWYRAFRKQGNRPKDALWSARNHVKAEVEAINTLDRLTPASLERIEAFVDDFIRGPEVEGLTSDRDSDFINEPARAARCHDGAEHGCDGKTHFEVIEDWRDAFGYWLDNYSRNDHDRFTDAVRARFTSTELWHVFNGSLFQEIG